MAFSSGTQQQDEPPFPSPLSADPLLQQQAPSRPSMALMTAAAQPYTRLDGQGFCRTIPATGAAFHAGIFIPDANTTHFIQI
jgi:hypothetical protein